MHGGGRMLGSIGHCSLGCPVGKRRREGHSIGLLGGLKLNARTNSAPRDGGHQGSEKQIEHTLSTRPAQATRKGDIDQRLTLKWRRGA